MSSTRKILEQLSSLQKGILNNPTLIGAHPNYNASAEEAMRIPDHFGPTKQTGTIDFQGGVIPYSPTTNSALRSIGSGYTGGWSGGAIYNSIGYFDRGNWAGQINAGIPDNDKQDNLYVQLYNKHHSMMLSTAIQKAADELFYQQSHDKYGEQTTATASNQPSTPTRAR